MGCCGSTAAPSAADIAKGKEIDLKLMASNKAESFVPKLLLLGAGLIFVVALNDCLGRGRRATLTDLVL